MGKAGAKKKKESGKKRKEAKTTKKERKALKRQAAVLEKKPAAAQGVQEAGGKITFAEPETTNDRLKQEPELSLFFVAEESGLAAGALLGYMEAEYQPATGGLRTECITTLHYPLSNFPQEVRRLQQKFQARTETEELEYCRFFFFLAGRPLLPAAAFAVCGFASVRRGFCARWAPPRAVLPPRSVLPGTASASAAACCWYAALFRRASSLCGRGVYSCAPACISSRGGCGCSLCSAARRTS